jgi:hypothetical protein
VLASASSRSRTFPVYLSALTVYEFLRKDYFAATPKVRAGLALAHETRALPIISKGFVTKFLEDFLYFIELLEYSSSLWHVA